MVLTMTIMALTGCGSSQHSTPHKSATEELAEEQLRERHGIAEKQAAVCSTLREDYPSGHIRTEVEREQGC